MEEWQKTLISVGAGFSAGLFAEPIKAALARRRQRRLVADGIDRAMTDICYTLEAITEDSSVKSLTPGLPFDLFEYYFDKEKGLFYESVVGWHVCHFFDRAKKVLLEQQADILRQSGAKDLLTTALKIAGNDPWPHKFFGPYTHGALKQIRKHQVSLSSPTATSDQNSPG